MVRNTSLDLNNLLFEQLERLSDDDLDLETEIDRAQAMTGVSKEIIANSKLALEAQKFKSVYTGTGDLPIMLETNNDAK